MKDTADSVRKQATDLVTELVEMYFSRLQRLAFWLNPKQRDILLAFLNEWERKRLLTEHDFVKHNENEEEKLTSPTEDEIQILNADGNPTDYLLVDDPTWAMAPNGLAFGIIPRDLINLAEIHNHIGTRTMALHQMQKILEELGFDEITKNRKEGK